MNQGLTDVELQRIQEALDALPSKDFFFDVEFEQTAFKDDDRTLYVNLEGPADDPVTQFFLLAPRAVEKLLAEVRMRRTADHLREIRASSPSRTSEEAYAQMEAAQAQRYKHSAEYTADCPVSRRKQ